MLVHYFLSEEASSVCDYVHIDWKGIKIHLEIWVRLHLNSGLFMALHLMRAQSDYKGLQICKVTTLKSTRMCAATHLHTHTHTHTHTHKTTQIHPLTHCHTQSNTYTGASTRPPTPPNNNNPKQPETHTYKILFLPRSITYLER